MANAEIQFLFGAHGVEQADSIGLPIQNHVEDLLAKNDQGTVYVYLEHGASPQSLSKRMTQMVTEGIPPSRAYLLTGYFNSHSSQLPDSPDQLDLYAENFYSNPKNAYEKEYLGAVDDLVKKYNQIGQSPRVNIIVEGVPDNLFPDYLERHYVMDQFKGAYHVEVKKGQFDRALFYFKEETLRLGEDSVERENRIVEQLTSLSSDPQTAGIVVPFGEGHTRMQHLIRSRGIASKMKFLEQTDYHYWFLPAVAVTRKVAMKGAQAVTELEWYQSMIGESIYELFAKEYMQANKPVPHQELLNNAIKIAKRLKTMEDIRSYEDIVRAKGFNRANKKTIPNILRKRVWKFR